MSRRRLRVDPRSYTGAAPLIFAAPMPLVFMAWGESWTRVAAGYLLSVLYLTMYGSWVRRHSVRQEES